MKLIGYYNEQGYRIANVETGETLYSAGNHPKDSQQCVSLKEGLSLKHIKLFCVLTLEEMASEHAETGVMGEVAGFEYEEKL